MALKREIGLIGLTFVAVGGVLGSGWLFAPLLTSQLAGPGALLAWGIGAVAMLLLALAYGELTSMFPVAGGIARLPTLSHGHLLAMFMGWSAWVGYCTTAPIEVEASMQYAAGYVPWLHTGKEGALTLTGQIVACILLALFTVINAFGVQWFARINTTLTWFKLVVPLIFVVAIIATQFDASNFTAYDGFMPFGISGVFAAISTGGVVFAFIGFRHAIDMAGEARNPQTTIPLALIFAVVICLLVYGLIQISFIGALQPDDLANGWANLSFQSSLGPLGALAMAVGILWLVSLLNVAAVIAPMGGGLVSTGSNARIAMAMANNETFPAIFARLNVFGVPLYALILNYVVGLILVFLVPFDEIVALNGAAIILSFVAGPIGVIALRQLAADRKRTFLLPAAAVLAPLGFVIASLMIYWSGWNTMWPLLLLLAVGLVLFLIRVSTMSHSNLHIKGAIWFGPYIAGLAILSYLGGFGGGLDVIPHPWDTVIVAVFSFAMFYLAVRAALSPEEFAEVMEDQKRLDQEQHGTETPA